MPNYVLLYTTTSTKPEEESELPLVDDDGFEDDGIDDVEEDLDEAADVTQMQEWMAWSERVGDALVDFGLPLGYGRAVTAAGSSASASKVTGYSIIKASDIESAIDLVQGHPHLNEGTIEVFEAIPLAPI
ncbi:MAG: hypothetical protein JWQ68_633 [Cryobacterium sp.]|jgi:hypothetical protein|nr:hypothetical protein [Cryobacterium sp.]